MKRAIWAWTRALAGLGIIGVLVWQVGTGAFVAGLREVDPRGVLAALAIGLATTVSTAWRWRVIARRLGLRLSLLDAVTDYYRALFLNAVLPAGVLGDVHRAVRHGRNEGDVGRGIRAVVLERAAGQVVLVVAGAAVLLARPAVFPERLRAVVTAAAAAVLVVAVAAPAVAVVVGRVRARRGPLPAHPAGRAAGRFRAGHGPVAARHHGAVPGRLRPSRFARTAVPGAAFLSITLLSAVALAGHLAMFLVAARAAGATASTGRLLPLMVLALLAMGVPLNIGGWGPREGATALAFGAAGLSAAQGLTTAVVYGVLALVASLPGAGVLLLQSFARPRPEGPPALRPEGAEANLVGVGGGEA